jgi:phage gpG-like protein
VKRSEGIVHIAAGDQHVPYAKIHNEGFNGTQTVKSFRRRTKKGSAVVRSHSRRMVMPQRQFMGDSQMLNANIDRIIIREISALERQLFNG